MSKVHELNQLGQSIWYDNIRRALLDHGELQSLIAEGVTGVTSNPTIFEKAIVGSADYDADLRRLAAAGGSITENYESLALEDIRRTADLLRPIYERTGRADGYISFEVSPALADDTESTVTEARRLFTVLGRPNVMVKVPATAAGIPAIAVLIGEGINVNVTLIFSLAQYQAVAEAYLSGLQALAMAGGDLRRVASVASFFISRIDSGVDRALTQPGAADLLGTIAVANAKIAYAHFRKILGGPRWERLAEHGARVQRLLWASTGTKNPLYPDTHYVDGLIGPDTVNTVPPATLRAFLDHGSVAPTLESGLAEAHAKLSRLAKLGIDLDAITQQLLDEDVAAFAKSFEALMAGIAEKRDRLSTGEQSYTAQLGSYQATVDAARAELHEQQVMERLWAHDYTLWKPKPTEISNRLGWLHSPEVVPEAVPALGSFVEAVRADGYTHALLLGMGGSSLAAEVFRRTFGVKEGYLDLAVLDSTDPGAVLAHAERVDPARRLFIVSTKSGGTVETLSLFKYFYNRVAKAVGAAQAGAHFVAITDPSSALAETAGAYHFRATFLNDPNIGGRYSALSYFGLLPAALVGVDLAVLLDRALTMACNCAGCNCPVRGDNSGAWLGTIMGELAAAGRDKLTLIASPLLVPFGVWVEQLLAESTGKEGRGILPVADEPLGAPAVYGDDRLFVYLRLTGDTTHDAAVQALVDAGQPSVQINLRDAYDLGGEFFRWEIATAVAGRRLGINPFDQPNVESAKTLAHHMLAAYQQTGTLPPLAPVLQADGIGVYAVAAARSLGEALDTFLSQCRAGDYLALQAYVEPTAATTAALQALRILLRDRLHVATTLGYGPRFLHSTGQLHKGDAGNGLFIQITADDPRDVPIPDKAGKPASSSTFRVLKAAQALGDRQALLDAGRRVIRLHLGSDVVGGLRRLREALA